MILEYIDGNFLIIVEFIGFVDATYDIALLRKKHDFPPRKRSDFFFLIFVKLELQWSLIK